MYNIIHINEKKYIFNFVYGYTLTPRILLSIIYFLRLGIYLRNIVCVGGEIDIMVKLVF